MIFIHFVLHLLQITGGKLNHTTILRFENTNEELTILQKFDGLNAWDQLAVEINVNGRVPFVNASTAVSYPDISEEYVFQSEEILQAHGNVSIRVDGEEILITSEQSVSISALNRFVFVLIVFSLLFSLFAQIEFDKCPNSDDSIDLSPIFSKLIRTTSEYQENEEALRIGLINKINRNTPVNPCTDGTASCGPNSICIPNPNHESYSVSILSIPKLIKIHYLSETRNVNEISVRMSQRFHIVRKRFITSLC